MGLYLSGRGLGRVRSPVSSGRSYCVVPIWQVTLRSIQCQRFATLLDVHRGRVAATSPVVSVRRSVLAGHACRQILQWDHSIGEYKRRVHLRTSTTTTARATADEQLVEALLEFLLHSFTCQPRNTTQRADCWAWATGRLGSCYDLKTARNQGRPSPLALGSNLPHQVAPSNPTNMYALEFNCSYSQANKNFVQNRFFLGGRGYKPTIRHQKKISPVCYLLLLQLFKETFYFHLSIEYNASTRNYGWKHSSRNMASAIIGLLDKTINIYTMSQLKTPPLFL